MNIQDSWEKAVKSTQIIRPRVQPLQTFESTRIPYIFLSESAVNNGDTVVRKGEVVVEKPALLLPFNLPQFQGFDFEEGMQLNEDMLKTFFLVRGISFPSLKFNNKTDAIEVFENKLSKAIEYYSMTLSRSEDVHTGLIAGSQDVWPFAVLLFTCGQAAKSAEGDFKKLYEDYRRKGLMS